MTNLTSSALPRSKASAPTGASAKSAPAPAFSITLKPLHGEGIVNMFDRLAIALKDADAEPAHLIILGSVGAYTASIDAMRRAFGQVDWPVTWVEGASSEDHPIAGIQAFAFSAGQVNPITLNGQVVGSVFEEGAMRHCMLGGLGPDSCSASSPDQFRQTLENLTAALEQAGFALKDVIRTWFYLDDLLSWYGPFNEVRTKIFSRIKFRSGSMPASTGISASNPAGSALVAGVWALQPIDPSARAAEVHSPLQCPASAYGSSFSRAMEISSPQGRHLLISGTASIAPGGATLWPEDVRRQIDLTMEVVEAILLSRGMGLSDITRATAYFKHQADMPAFAKWSAGRGLPLLPVVAAQCGICRDDLLFELEADAWAATPRGDGQLKA